MKPPTRRRFRPVMKRSDRRHYHEQVSDQLRLYSVSAAPGTRLPSIREMARQFNVTDSTVKQGLITLQREGLIVLRQGAGTFTRGGEL